MNAIAIADEATLASRATDLLLRWAAQQRAPAEHTHPFIGGGSLLSTCVLAEASQLAARDDDARTAAAHLERAAALFDAMPLSSSLYRGITGLGWAVQTFPQPALLPWRDETLADLDALLAEGVDTTSRPNIDVINGLAGIAIYAVERGANADSSRELWQALDARIGDYLTVWLATAPRDTPRDATVNNLGFAHGIPGLVAVAAVACARGLMPGREALLCACLDALWQCALIDADGANYAYYRADDRRGRLAWCYGGLGIAAMFRHGAALDRRNIDRFNSVCAASLAQYASGDHGFRDASLCHGDAGAALSFQYFADSGLASNALAASLRAAAACACADALAAEQRRDGRSVYLHSTAQGMAPSVSLLEGGAGIALALAAMHAGGTRPWMGVIGYF